MLDRQKHEQVLNYLTHFIEENVNSNTILNGLGELLTENQKDHVRATLKRDLIFDLKLRSQSL